MSLLRWIEWFIRMFVLAWIDLRQAGVRRILVGYFLLQVLVLYICADPVSEMWSSLMVPVIRGAFGDYYLHYPQSYIGLPVTGSATRVVLELLVGPYVLAWCAWAIRARLEGERLGQGELRRRSASCYLPLLGLGIIQLTVWLLAYGLPLDRLNASGLLSYRLHSGLTLMGGLFPVVLLAPLFYTAPHLVLEQSGLRAALRGSWRRFRSQGLLTLVLATLPWLVGLPFTQVLQRSARLAGMLRPEMILVVMAVQALVALLTGFLVISVAMRLYRKPKSEGR